MEIQHGQCFWERRLLNIQKMPKTLDAAKILLPMLHDEIFPVKMHAKATLYKYFDFSMIQILAQGI